MHVANYMLQTNPPEEALLKWESSAVARFFRFMHPKVAALNGQIMISGSFSLYLYLVFSGLLTANGHIFVPNDVDFYVNNIDVGILRALVVLFQIENADLSFEEKRSLVCDDNYPACWDYNVKDETSDEKFQLQIIPWGSGRSSQALFASRVTENFDISVVRTAILDPNNMNEFFFHSHGCHRDIVEKRFSYTIREFSKQSSFQGRIQKYIRRGFQPYKVLFQRSNIKILLEGPSDITESDDEGGFSASSAIDVDD
jgi:hypothetical protein